MRAAATQARTARNVPKRLALEQNNAPTGEPLVTPNQMDKVNKQNTADVWQAFNGIQKRHEAVAGTPADTPGTKMPHDFGPGLRA